MGRPAAIQKTTVYFRDVPKHLKDLWKSVCAKRGKSMLKRFEELMLADIRADAANRFKQLETEEGE